MKNKIEINETKPESKLIYIHSEGKKKLEDFSYDNFRLENLEYMYEGEVLNLNPYISLDISR